MQIFPCLQNKCCHGSQVILISLIHIFAQKYHFHDIRFHFTRFSAVQWQMEKMEEIEEIEENCKGRIPYSQKASRGYFARESGKLARNSMNVGCITKETFCLYAPMLLKTNPSKSKLDGNLNRSLNNS